MQPYRAEEKLKLTRKVYITEEVYQLLAREKRRQKVSKAKLACNAIIGQYAQQEVMHTFVLDNMTKVT